MFAPYFSAVQLESLEALSPKQTAELLLLPLTAPPKKDEIIHRVFDFLTESPEERRLPEVLHHLVKMAQKVDTFSAVTLIKRGCVPIRYFLNIDFLLLL